MSVTEQTGRRRDACPHCGKPVALRWRSLLPSNDRNRVLTCAACGRHYDTSDGCKVASIVGGLLGLGPGVLLFGRIVKVGGHSRAAVIVGTATIMLVFGLASILFARVMLALIPKP